MLSEAPSLALLPEFYTREDVARLLQVSLRSVDEMLKRNEIPRTKLGRIVRIPRAQLEAVLAESTLVPPASGAFSSMMLNHARVGALRELLEREVRKILEGMEREEEFRSRVTLL
jgi:excisionase family DNA binding protein